MRRRAGTALSPDDFTAASGQLVFPAGTSGEKTVVVKVKGDTRSSPTRPFSLVLSGVVNGKLDQGNRYGDGPERRSGPGAGVTSDACVDVD